jgi:Domain of unknown function (DUF4187)
LAFAAAQTIETLDERGGVERHQLWPLLLPPPPAASEDAEAAGGSETAVELPPWEMMPAQQRLANVLEYLRGQHSYCLFCGCQVNNGLPLALLPGCMTPHWVHDHCTEPCPCSNTPFYIACSSAMLQIWLPRARDQLKTTTDAQHGCRTIACDMSGT